MMTRVFQDQLYKKVKMYFDDMIVKTTDSGNHVVNLEEVFAQPRKHNIRLNPLKCAFEVQAGKILGFMNQGIKVKLGQM